MLPTYKDESGYSQMFKDTPALRVRSRKRCQKIINYAEIKGEQKLLEIGCGLGDYASLINNQTGAEVIGLDQSPIFINQARQRHRQAKLSFQAASALAMPFANASFDLVYGNGILHHLPDKRKLFKEIKRVLKIKGKIVFIEPNIYNPAAYLIFRSFIRKFAQLEPMEDLFTRSAIIKDLTEAGFTEIKITSVDFILPVTPKFLIKVNMVLDKILENFFLLKELSQSILIYAENNNQMPQSISQ